MTETPTPTPTPTAPADAGPTETFVSSEPNTSSALVTVPQKETPKLVMSEELKEHLRQYNSHVRSSGETPVTPEVLACVNKHCQTLRTKTAKDCITDVSQSVRNVPYNEPQKLQKVYQDFNVDDTNILNKCQEVTKRVQQPVESILSSLGGDNSLTQEDLDTVYRSMADENQGTTLALPAPLTAPVDAVAPVESVATKTKQILDSDLENHDTSIFEGVALTADELDQASVSLQQSLLSAHSDDDISQSVETFLRTGLKLSFDEIEDYQESEAQKRVSAVASVFARKIVSDLKAALQPSPLTAGGQPVLPHGWITGAPCIQVHAKT